MSALEDRIIQALLGAAPAAPAWVATGPGDDAAILRDPPPGAEVISSDAMVEGVHWDDRLTAADVGERLVMVNASDLAACGATPRWATLALSLPSPPDLAWVGGFAAGLGRGLERAGMALIGGDTTRSPGPIFASLTVGGRLSGPDRALLRSAAMPGEDLWVSGTLGDAAGGFYLGDPPPALRAALARPRPPLALGPALAARRLSRAAMDLSDGLATDLARLCAASGCGAEVDPSALPISAALRARAPDPLPLQVGFGDDYQLLFTARPADRNAVRALGAELGVRLTRIGRLDGGEGARLTGRPWPPGWRHFA